MEDPNKKQKQQKQLSPNVLVPFDVSLNNSEKKPVIHFSEEGKVALFLVSDGDFEVKADERKKASAIIGSKVHEFQEVHGHFPGEHYDVVEGGTLRRIGDLELHLVFLHEEKGVKFRCVIVVVVEEEDTEISAFLEDFVKGSTGPEQSHINLSNMLKDLNINLNKEVDVRSYEGSLTTGDFDHNVSFFFLNSTIKAPKAQLDSYRLKKKATKMGAATARVEGSESLVFKTPSRFIFQSKDIKTTRDTVTFNNGN